MLPLTDILERDYQSYTSFLREIENMNYSAHPDSIIEPNAVVGARTRVWAFAHLLPGAIIGDDCNICDGVFIEGNVRVGNRTTIKCGVQLWSGLRVGHDVFIGPNATFSNDRFPRSQKHPAQYPETVLGDNCSIGANATILPGLVIGRNAMVGAGSVVTKSVPPYAIVAGNPAEIVGYENAKTPTATPSTYEVNQATVVAKTRVLGVTFHQMTLIQDLRGDLSAGEFSKGVPFTPKRYFSVFNVKNREIRGEHALHHCEQFLLCLVGSCRVVADDGMFREEFVLDEPTKGLYLPPLTWASQYKYSPDAMLLVFASEYYDAGDYIRDYEEFVRLAHIRGRSDS